MLSFYNDTLKLTSGFTLHHAKAGGWFLDQRCVGNNDYEGFKVHAVMPILSVFVSILEATPVFSSGVYS